MKIKNVGIVDETSLRVRISDERFKKLSLRTLKELDAINICLEPGDMTNTGRFK